MRTGLTRNQRNFIEIGITTDLIQTNASNKMKKINEKNRLVISHFLDLLKFILNELTQLRKFFALSKSSLAFLINTSFFARLNASIASF